MSDYEQRRTRLLPSGYRWVELWPGERFHILNVEHHWKPDPTHLGGSLFDFEAPMASATECGVSTEGGRFVTSVLLGFESECCPDCWKLPI